MPPTHTKPFAMSSQELFSSGASLTNTQIFLIVSGAISPRAGTGACALPASCRTTQHPITCSHCGPLRRSYIRVRLPHSKLSPCVHLTWVGLPCAFRHQPWLPSEVFALRDIAPLPCAVSPCSLLVASAARRASSASLTLFQRSLSDASSSVRSLPSNSFLRKAKLHIRVDHLLPVLNSQ